MRLSTHMYRIDYRKQALHDIERLPLAIHHRILRELEAAAQNPIRSFVRLSGRTDYKLRIGHYRLIAEIDHGDQTIFVTQVGHRKNVYER